MSKQIDTFSKLFACACVAVLFGAAGCGDDDSGSNMMAGGAGSGSFGTGGQPTTGSGGNGAGTGGSMNSSGGTGGKTGGSGGTNAGTGGTNGGSGGASAACAAQSCDGTCCGDECVADLDTDADHCGSCGKACRTGDKCTDGLCVSMPRMCDAGDDDAGATGDNGCLPNEKCLSIDGAEGECRCGSGPGCPENESCNKSGKCMCGKNAGCDTGEGCCDGECLDLQTDEDNCGECGNVCATGATCTAGECECDDEDFVDCDGRCVAIDTEANCGECGNECEDPSTCRDPNGSRPLGCYCPNVNEVPCDGACVALGTIDNCGECGDACTGAESVCRNGSCQCPTVGQTACGDTCVDLRTGVDTAAGDPVQIENCGKCGVDCLAGAACNNGQCACPSASTTDMYCDEDPGTGKTDGNYMCIEVKTTKNCGACGNACLDDSECRSSSPGTAPSDFSCACIGDDAGKTHCTGIGCRSLNNDEANCGQCGRECPDNVNCIAGQCDCPGGSAVESCVVDGEPKCTDTDTDKDNCGGCGIACDPGEDCCEGNCVDADTAFDEDNQNCGSCGHDCPNSGCGFLMLFSCSCNNGVCN